MRVPVVSEPESTRVILDDAWGHIPQTRETTAGLGSFTRLRIERIISVVVGLGSLALGAQAFFTALTQPAQETIAEIEATLNGQLQPALDRCILRTERFD